jgi:hypothetical protein
LCTQITVGFSTEVLQTTGNAEPCLSELSECRTLCRIVGHLSGIVGTWRALSEHRMSGVVGRLSGVCRALCFDGHTLSVVLRSSTCRNVGMSEPLSECRNRCRIVETLSDCRNVCVGLGWARGVLRWTLLPHLRTHRRHIVFGVWSSRVLSVTCIAISHGHWGP